MYKAMVREYAVPSVKPGTRFTIAMPKWAMVNRLGFQEDGGYVIYASQTDEDTVVEDRTFVLLLTGKELIQEDNEDAWYVDTHQRRTGTATRYFVVHLFEISEA